jgi:rhodanese-related sulfurtransferase
LNFKSLFSNFSLVPWKQTLQEAWGLFVFAAFFAVLFNTFYADGISLKVEPPKNHHIQDLLKSNVSTYPGWKSSTAKPALTSSVSENLSLDQILRINLVGAKSRFDQKSCVFLDARSPEEYTEGHIPGALEFYANDFEKFAPQILPQLKDKHQELITYCHGSSCDLSLQLANNLIQQGYTNVKVFFGGWPEWKKANYPINTGDQP